MTRRHFFTLGLACLAPLMSYADDVQIDGIYYTLQGDTAIVAVNGYNGTNSSSGLSSALEIPESVTYDGTTYPVTALATNAFRSVTSIKSVVLPSSVKSLGSYAFQQCTALKTVDLSAATLLTSIPISCFQQCEALKEIIWPEATNLTTINGQAFYRCSALTEVVLPAGLTTVNIQAFEGYTFGTTMAIKKIVLPSTLTYIGSEAFSVLPNLTTVICYAATPPGMYTPFKSIGTATLYVPDVALDDYVNFTNSSGTYSGYFSTIIGFATQYDVSPESGETVYGDLDEIVLASAGQFVAQGSKSDIVITNGSVSKVTCTGSADDDGNYTCTIALTGTEEASDWTITIPAGYFIGQTEDIVLTYDIEPARTTSEFTFDPADGGVTMGSVSGLDITANGWVALAAEDVSGLTVTAGEDVSVACKEVTVGEQDEDGTTAITCTLASEITDAGTYTVTIPEGFFYVSTDDATLTNTEAITSTFTIAAIESDPADGAEVTDSLTAITLTSNAQFELGENVSESSATVTDALGTATYATVEKCEIAEGGLSCTLTLSKAVTDSPCTLVVPEGYFTFMDNGDFTATFTIVKSENENNEEDGEVETGIAGITAAELEPANVYNVAGQRVSTLVNGQVNIVRKADGTVKKVLVK